MNRNKIKIKYLLNLWKSLPEYPTQEDVVYEITSYLFKEGKRNGPFSIQTLNGVFGSGWEETKIKDIVEQMIETGEFEVDPKTSGDKKWYKIKDNPYYQ